MHNVWGKNVVITGAARGIGYATAQAMLSHGARVVIGDRDGPALQSAVAELSSLGPVSGHSLDVTDRDSFTAFLEGVRADGGPDGHIDVLINNAGVMPIGSFLEQSEDAIRAAVEVNFYGVLNGCQLVLPEMARRGGGHIVNIASMAGMVAVPGQVAYAGSKFAVVGMSTALADEVASLGIKVSAVLPTFTNTELISGTATTGPQKPMEPQRIAAAVVRVLDRPRTLVSVPGGLRYLGAVWAVLPDRARRAMNRRTGNERVFLDFDGAERGAYEQRARTATGVIDADC
jgi:NAD(P)-dependent dehydrogenase (short-subunit alcohol dehydrogenase family)